MHVRAPESVRVNRFSNFFFWLFSSACYRARKNTEESDGNVFEQYSLWLSERFVGVWVPARGPKEQEPIWNEKLWGFGKFQKIGNLKKMLEANLVVVHEREVTLLKGWNVKVGMKVLEKESMDWLIPRINKQVPVLFCRTFIIVPRNSANPG